jgi:hypothetical protein
VPVALYSSDEKTGTIQAMTFLRTSRRCVSTCTSFPNSTLDPGAVSSLRGRRDDHSFLDGRGAGAHDTAIYSGQAGVASLNGTKRRMVADLGEPNSGMIDEIDQAIASEGLVDHSVNLHSRRSRISISDGSVW